MSKYDYISPIDPQISIYGLFNIKKYKLMEKYKTINNINSSDYDCRLYSRSNMCNTMFYTHRKFCDDIFFNKSMINGIFETHKIVDPLNHQQFCELFCNHKVPHDSMYKYDDIKDIGINIIDKSSLSNLDEINTIIKKEFSFNMTKLLLYLM